MKEYYISWKYLNLISNVVTFRRKLEKFAFWDISLKIFGKVVEFRVFFFQKTYSFIHTEFHSLITWSNWMFPKFRVCCCLFVCFKFSMPFEMRCCCSNIPVQKTEREVSWGTTTVSHHAVLSRIGVVYEFCTQFARPQDSVLLSELPFTSLQLFFTWFSCDSNLSNCPDV